MLFNENYLYLVLFDGVEIGILKGFYLLCDGLLYVVDVLCV